MTQAQPESHGDKNRMVMVIAIFALVALFIYTWYTGGSVGLSVLVKQFIKYAILASVLGLILWAVLKYLQKPKVDLVANDRKAIIDAGLLSKPPMVRDLYFTGDKEHGEFRVGKIIGYVQLQSYKDLDLIAGLTQTQIADMEKNGTVPADYIIKEDCFIFKKMGFPFSLFEEPKVLRVLEDEHSQIIGDVKIYGVSMIQKFDYYFPNRAHLDIARIDIGIIREAWRGQVHQFLKDMVAINQRAVGLDSEFKKDLDHRKLLKIPSPMGEDESRRGNG